MGSALARKMEGVLRPAAIIAHTDLLNARLKAAGGSKASFGILAENRLNRPLQPSYGLIPPPLSYFTHSPELGPSMARQCV
jgi:hypothetical protein